MFSTAKKKSEMKEGKIPLDTSVVKYAWQVSHFMNIPFLLGFNTYLLTFDAKQVQKLGTSAYQPINNHIYQKMYLFRLKKNQTSHSGSDRKTRRERTQSTCIHNRKTELSPYFKHSLVTLRYSTWENDKNQQQLAKIKILTDFRSISTISFKYMPKSQ